MTLNLRYIEIEPGQFFNDPRGHPNQQHEPRKLVFPLPSRAVNLQRKMTVWILLVGLGLDSLISCKKETL